MRHVRTLANCNKAELREIQSQLHPATDRRLLIFAAGALGNKRLENDRDFGSMERSIFYDGQVAAGLITANPYWPDYSDGQLTLGANKCRV
jgi:hypothetical protein